MTFLKMHKQHIIAILLLLTCTIFFNSCSTETPTVEPIIETKPAWRIVSLSGTITELLYEFKLDSSIVGVDVTSVYPEAVRQIPNLGHSSQLNAEAILALKPNLVLIDEKNKDNKVLENLKTAGIAIQIITIPQQLDGVLTAAKQLGEILKQTLDTKTLENKINSNKLAISDLLQQNPTKPKVLFIYARGAQAMMVAGKNTFAEKMIEIAGGTHVIQAFEDFKPLTPEALLQYQPDIVLMFDSGLASLADEAKKLSGEQQLLAIQGMSKTPAGKNKRIITMEGLYLSSFGPRASDAALELAKKIHAKF